MTRNAQRPSPQRRAPITLDEDDDDDELEFLFEISRDEVQTNFKIPQNCTSVHSVSCKAGTLRPDSRVELTDGDFMHIKEIYRDSRKPGEGNIFLKGNLMRRTFRAKGMMEKKINELFYVLTTTTDHQNPSLDQCLVTRTLEDVKRPRHITVTNQKFPAYSWREQQENYDLSDEEKLEHLRLVCRWKFADELHVSGTNVTGGFMRRVSEQECDRGKRVARLEQLRDFLGEQRTRQAIRTHGERIRADEEDFVEVLNASPTHLDNNRKRSRDRMVTDDTIELMDDVIDLTGDVQIRSTRTEVNETIRRLSSEIEITTKRKRKMSTTIHTADPRIKQTIKDSFATSRISGDHPQKRTRFSNHELRRPAQQLPRYVYADICAGAGGMASGAAQAGLKIEYLLDNWPEACETLSANFPGARVLLKDVFDFCNSKRHWPWEQVDVLHISYPCQPHSYLNPHDRDGGKNPDNIATSFATQRLLARCKPRIVTFEQTSHIITKNRGEFFRKIIHDLTSEGYDVRWRICDLAEYGTVQRRRRLIIIASCPGETLPKFPDPTHGLGYGLKKPTTVRQVLRGLQPHKAGMSDLMRSSRPRDGIAYNADAPLKGLITCDGGVGNLHPSGRRTFELCELAALQSFLATHQFSGGKTAILKQIGNAVPSCFAKTLFEHITASLRETDRQLAEYKPETVSLLDD